MKLIKVAAPAINQTPFDWDNNTDNIKAAPAANGRLFGLVAKQNLAGHGIHYGPRFSFNSFELTSAIVDSDHTREQELARSLETLIRAYGGVRRFSPGAFARRSPR